MAAATVPRRPPTRRLWYRQGFSNRRRRRLSSASEPPLGEVRILPFDWADPFALDAQLSDEEKLVRDTAEGYAQEKLQPRVTSAFLDENFDRGILTEMGELGLLGATIPHEYGGAGPRYCG